jgi:hypothetical protein
MWMFLVPSLLVSFQLATVGEKATICPTIVASLMNVPGNLDATTSAQRVEIRRCVVHAARSAGAVQLVAWGRSSQTPDLVLNLEETGFHQIAMIEGVYAFELIGGKAQEALVIVFERGKPKVALEVSTLGKVVITSDRERLLVDVSEWDRETKREVEHHYLFPAGRGETRRY